MDIVPYTPDPAEEAEITAMREHNASEVRAWVRQYANDPAVSDLDFAHSLHRLTYDQVRVLAKRAIDLHLTNGGTL